MPFTCPSHSLVKTALLWVLLMFFFASCATPPEHTIGGKTMGTTYQVKISGDLASPAALKKDIDALLAEINLKMSTYIADSEISRFNRSKSTEWRLISNATLEVLKKALEVHSQSAGAFDITIGPLVNLWGFGPEKHADEKPDPAAIDAARRSSGMNLLEIDAPHRKIRKLHPDVRIDLSAIAKGYGVDQVALLLKKRNIHNFLVEIGGEISAQGHKNNGQPWIVAIERAVDSARQAQQLLPLSGLALATSGSYRNYFEENGVRYSHTIDPATGWPINHTLVSVSVAAADCMSADAWATALMVLGPDKGRKAAEQHNIAALFIEKKASTFNETTSSKWNSLLP